MPGHNHSTGTTWLQYQLCTTPKAAQTYPCCVTYQDSATDWLDKQDQHEAKVRTWLGSNLATTLAKYRARACDTTTWPNATQHRLCYRPARRTTLRIRATATTGARQRNYPRARAFQYDEPRAGPNDQVQRARPRTQTGTTRPSSALRCNAMLG